MVLVVVVVVVVVIVVVSLVVAVGGIGWWCLWWHWFMVFVVAIGIHGVCGIGWWCLWWLLVFMVFVALVGGVCGGGGYWKQSEAEERYKNNVEGRGQGSVDGDEENESEKKEDVNKVIEDDLLARAEDFDKFNNYPWGYDNFYLTIRQSYPQGRPHYTTFLGLSWWLAAKSNTKIKETDLFSPSEDAVNTIIDPTVELIRKELAEATAIIRAIRQGQPNVEALHDQPTKADLGAFFGGAVSVGGRHADATTTRDDEHVDVKKINMFENTPFHPYTEAYDAADRIMDLDFYKKLKDKYDQLNSTTLDYGAGFDFLVSTLEWDEEEIIKYIRGERPNPHGKSWTKAKRILVVISMNDIYYQVVEILLEEGKIKVYDCNEPAVDDVDLFLFMQPLMERPSY
ncbi:hypothetical protein FXO38_25780 [Capsicum annuum]|nr:hypothetical protein FXO38_25780 [Capsicum annuum]KAF3665225.1 hypothetical protein FXO37_11134 [Capsicum annuum]